MGYEYVIKLRENDWEAFSRNSNGPKSMDELLKSVPVFRKFSGATYFYSADEKKDPRWLSYIRCEGRELKLCSYSGEDYRAIVPYLFDQFMHICGHFEIEEG